MAVLFLTLSALVAAASQTATLVGAVYDLAGDPIPEASVELYLAVDLEEEEEEKERPLSLGDRPWLFVDEPLYRTMSDEDGLYRIEGIIPGTYDTVCHGDYLESCYNLDIRLAAGEERHLNFALRELIYEVEKPNLYLYPETQTEITVRLEFPAGGGVTVSEPTYGDGWTVNVTSDGRIDGEYDYLFYEATVPPEWQFERAWVVQKRQVETFFRENLADHGFNDREIADFVEYWVPRLADFPFYVIYPQYTKEIEPLIRLIIEPEPDSLLRLYYAISGVDFVERYVPEPEPRSFPREGFTVVEWGVILEEFTSLLH
ncbi:carboxypeptidase regulatory-like domain-containing protein [bacterium]|nr:carboxypeptidase regulatory-like domain-containing protein [bacterium]